MTCSDSVMTYDLDHKKKHKGMLSIPRLSGRSLGLKADGTFIWLWISLCMQYFRVVFVEETSVFRIHSSLLRLKRLLSPARHAVVTVVASQA